MSKNFENFKIEKLKRIGDTEFNEILDLILKENPQSILSSLSKKNIRKYLEEITKSDKIDIFIVKNKSTIIAYSIISERVEYLISIFSNMKFKILYDLLSRFKFIKIIDIMLSYFKFDLLLLSNKEKKIINSNYNLNLLAVRHDFQSKGIGSYFLKQIFNKISSSKYISVESINKKAYDFYKKKHNFMYIDKKLRLFKNLKVLYKELW